MLSSRYTFHRELTGSLQAVSRRRNHRNGYRDDWIDNQLQLNHAVYKVGQGDTSLQAIKVIQSYGDSTGQPLSVHKLLSTLVGCDTVRSLSLVGVNVDRVYGDKLLQALADIQTSLETIQLCRLLPSGIPALCDGLRSNRQLREVRLTFNHDVSADHAHRLLTSALVKNTTLRALKLYCMDFDDDSNRLLAECLRGNTTLTDLRLSSCNLEDIHDIALAVRASNTLEVLDLSMNRISSHESLAVLLETPSLKMIHFSQNELGRDNDASSYRSVRAALAANTTLEGIFLDMNPISETFAECLYQALLGKNCTLTKLGLLTVTLRRNTTHKLRYMVSLNEAGRKWTHDDRESYDNGSKAFVVDSLDVDSNEDDGVQHSKRPKLLPNVLHRIHNEPDLLFGLLMENPCLWLSQQQPSTS